MEHAKTAGVSRSRAGFTLLEVLVALAVAGIALTSIYQLFSGNMRNVAASEDYVAACAAGEASLQRLLSRDVLPEGIWTETTGEGYLVEVRTTETLKERTGNLQVRALDVDLTVRWTEGARERVIRLRTLQIVKKGSAEPGTGA